MLSKSTPGPMASLRAKRLLNTAAPGEEADREDSPKRMKLENEEATSSVTAWHRDAARTSSRSSSKHYLNGKVVVITDAQRVDESEEDWVPSTSDDDVNLDGMGYGQGAEPEVLDCAQADEPNVMMGSPRMHKEKADEWTLWMSEEQVRNAYRSLKSNYVELEKLLCESELKKSVMEGEARALRQELRSVLKELREDKLLMVIAGEKLTNAGAKPEHVLD
ncbi:hypothetical protein DXG01_004081 [Tephrocybe rancida]|nr:hypothetical protein DXG01_004081 [Tephrocybe rancida]